MSGKIDSGQLCTVIPAKTEDLKVGDIVLCKVNGFQYLHLIKGRVNGWVGENGIYGKCVRSSDPDVERERK